MNRLQQQSIRVIICGIIILALTPGVSLSDPPSLAKVSIGAGGFSPVDDSSPFVSIFMNIDVANIGNMPSSFPHSSSAHSYSIDTSESHILGKSLKSDYFVGLSPWWSGMFMILGGGDDGWTPEEFDFSSYSDLTFWAKAASSSQNPRVCKLEIVDHDGVSSTQITSITTSWKKFSVSLSSLTDLNKARIKQLNIVYENTPIATEGGSFNGVVYFDEFQFE